MLSYRWMALADTRMGKQEVLLWTLPSTLVLGVEARTSAHARRLSPILSSHFTLYSGIVCRMALDTS